MGMALQAISDYPDVRGEYFARRAQRPTSVTVEDITRQLTYTVGKIVESLWVYDHGMNSDGLAEAHEHLTIAEAHHEVFRIIGDRQMLQDLVADFSRVQTAGSLFKLSLTMVYDMVTGVDVGQVRMNELLERTEELLVIPSTMP